MFGIQIRLDKHANKQKNTTHDEEKNQSVKQIHKRQDGNLFNM